MMKSLLQSQTPLLLLLLCALCSIFVPGCGLQGAGPQSTGQAGEEASGEASVSTGDGQFSATEQPEAPGREDASVLPPERAEYPEEFAIFQDYLDVIDGRAGSSSTILVEATVLSLNQSEVCPMRQESCPIAPYPSDWGMLQIDQILEATSATEDGGREDGGREEGTTDTGNVTRDSSNSEEQENREERPNTAGGRQPKPYPTLTAGLAVEALFVLTARPAKVRQIPYQANTSDDGGIERAVAPGSNDSDDSEVTTNQAIQSGNEFSAIPREGDLWVFTTGIHNEETVREVILPGLSVGSKFRAQVQYNGIVYISEYELLENR